MTIYSKRYGDILEKQIKILKEQNKLTKLYYEPESKISDSEYKEKMSYYNTELKKLEKEENI